MDVSEFVRLHNLLAERIKEYEQAVGRLPPIEVLNELRYALRAAVELLADPSNESDRVLELRARIHHALLCAYHDLVDGLVIEIPKLLDDLRLKYPISSREVAGPRLIEIMSHVKDARNTVKEARGNPDMRRETYEELYSNGLTAF